MRRDKLKNVETYENGNRRYFKNFLRVRRFGKSWKVESFKDLKILQIYEVKEKVNPPGTLYRRRN